jgi:sporulation integral membrane protein YtvI
MQQGAQKYLLTLAYGLGAVGLLWLLARFLLPWAAPFLLAYGLAALLEAPVGFLLRHGWRRSAAAGLLSLSLFALLGWAVFGLSLRGLSAVTDFAKQAPQIMTGIGRELNRLEGSIAQYIAAAPEGTAEYLEAALDSLGQELYGLPGFLSQWALDSLGSIAQSGPNILLFIVTAAIGTYFISSTYPKTTGFIMAQLPPRLREKLSGLEQDIKGSFGGFFRAQLILMLMTFFQLLVAFLVLRVESPIGLAAITALIDALPVFGTGVVLVPWAAYCWLSSNRARAAGLLITWGLVNLVRSCTNAKLLGDQIGLDPLASLLAVYVGWKVWGVLGMLSFPILLVTLQQLNDKGVIRLWRNV